MQKPANISEAQWQFCKNHVNHGARNDALEHKTAVQNAIDALKAEKDAAKADKKAAAAKARADAKAKADADAKDNPAPDAPGPAPDPGPETPPAAA